MLCHSFSSTETARNRCCTTLCNWEKGIQDTLSGYKRHACRETLVGRSWHTDRPFLRKCDIALTAVRKTNRYNRVKDGICSVRNCLDNLSLSNCWRNHGFMKNGSCFLSLGNDSTCAYHISNFNSYMNIPFLSSIKGINTYTTGNIFSGGFCDLLQRTLDTVENVMNDSRSQKNGNSIACSHYCIAWLQSCCLLENLYGSHALFQTNDLTDQLLRSNINHLGNLKSRVAFQINNRTVNAVDNTCFIHGSALRQI